MTSDHQIYFDTFSSWDDTHICWEQTIRHQIGSAQSFSCRMTDSDRRRHAAEQVVIMHTEIKQGDWLPDLGKTVGPDLTSVLVGQRRRPTGDR